MGMLDPRDGEQPWFAVKSHGYGSGLPIAWQGWACLVGFVALTMLIGTWLPNVGGIALIGLLAVGFVALSQRRSDAPWRWRWGGRD